MSYARTWQCPECGYCQMWSYIDLVRHGNPVCSGANCDTNMRLVPETAEEEHAERQRNKLIGDATRKQHRECYLVRVRMTHRDSSGEESFEAEVARRLNEAMRAGCCEIAYVFQTNIPEKNYIDIVDVHFILRRP